MSVGAAEETLRILRGERPLSLVNPEVWDAFLLGLRCRPKGNVVIDP